MRSKGIVILAIVLMAIIAITGCGVSRQDKTSKTAEFSKGPAEQTSTSPAPEAVKPTEKEASIEIIRIDKNETISVAAGARDGIFLGDYIDATDTRDNTPITRMAYGAPRWGSIKAYGTGHYRYYPPFSPCTDEIPVTLLAVDGKSKDIVVKVQVTSGTNRRPAETSKADFSIVTPQSWQTIEGHVCDIEGTAPASMSGGKIRLFVRTQYGDTWKQGCSPEINNGRFTGFVYIGTEDGVGTGETYTIWAEAEGKVSNRVVVVREKPGGA